jgi:hypothetical protein
MPPADSPDGHRTDEEIGIDPDPAVAEMIDQMR